MIAKQKQRYSGKGDCTCSKCGKEGYAYDKITSIKKVNGGNTVRVYHYVKHWINHDPQATLDGHKNPEKLEQSTCYLGSDQP